MTCRTLDFSIALASRWPEGIAAKQSAASRSAFLERGHGDGFQLNLYPPESLRDQIVDPGTDGTEHEPHSAVEKGREDAEYQQNRSTDGADGASVGVEVTHLDPSAIGELGKVGSHTHAASVEEIVKSAVVAVKKKAGHYSVEEVSRTLLLLISPYPLPQDLAGEVATRFRKTMGISFREIWLAARNSPAVQLR